MLGSISGHDPRISKILSRSKVLKHALESYFNLRATFEIGILKPGYASDVPL